MKKDKKLKELEKAQKKLEDMCEKMFAMYPVLTTGTNEALVKAANEAYQHLISAYRQLNATINLWEIK